ncbi:MAG: hypothetical protein RL172_475, partial [Bacteroidota bacterium]
MLYAALHLTVVQNWLVSAVASNLSKKLNTSISIQHIDYSFFSKMDMKGLLVLDRKKDTLLFAGSARVNISDWFFLKDKPVLQYVELSDVVANVHRSDSVWNYQFLIDFFSSPKKAPSQSGGLAIDLKTVKLHNIRFVQTDEWVGRDMYVYLKNMDLQVDSIHMDRQKINIDKLLLDEPLFRQFDYTGNRDKLNLPTPAPRVKNSSHTAPPAWLIAAKNIRIVNGEFDSEKESTSRPPYPGRFDDQHIRFASIFAQLDNVLLQGDTLTTRINLATKERSGFEVKKLEANMKFTPAMMEFDSLNLVTNKSRLGNYYAMHYQDFNKDMGRFLHAVTLEGHFVNSELNSDDLAFFAPELAAWKRVFDMNGDAYGTVDNLSAKKIQLKTGNSMINGDITLRGLPDIENTFIDFNSRELQTNYAELVSIIPTLKNITQPNLNQLGLIKYKGYFTGFINDFVAYGTINSNLGTVTGDINLKLPDNAAPVYSGKISTEGFRLGEFISVSDIGSITFNGKVNGRGFTEKSLDANFDGNVRSVDYNGYTYQNIVVKGDFEKKLFRGQASINDPNIKVDKLSGTINFNASQPEFNFDAQLNHANFKKLQLTNDDFSLSGRFNLNFTGNNIDNFLGTARITDAALIHNGLPMSFDSLLLRSDIQEGDKFLSLRTNEVEADLKGKFTILELPAAFNVFLSRYYPAYIKKPARLPLDQNFSFEVRTKEIDPYIELIDKKLKGFNNSTLTGNLHLTNNQLNITANVPEFSYDGKIFTGTLLESKGNMDSLTTRINVEDVAINDSLRLPGANLQVTSFKDTSIVSIKTSASKTLSEAAINARVITMADGVNIHFYPSSFIISDKKWQLEKDGEISFRKSGISASEVKFLQGNQQITIGTEPSDIGNYEDVVVTLQDVSVEDFTAFAIKQPRLEGLMTGTIRVSDPLGKPYIEYDTRVNDFKAGTDTIGELNLKGNYDIKKGLIVIKGTADKNKNNLLDIDGVINLGDSSGTETKLLLKSERLDLALLNNFLGDIFSDIRGYANTSDLTFTGKGKNLQLTGTANITEGSLIVNFTQCKYKFKNESIVFNPDEIDFGSIVLTDTLNNTAQMSGKMYHHFFDDIEFEDIRLSTDRLLVLNTTKKDNSQFYGKVVGKAGMVLSGTQDNIVMNITGEPSRLDSSHIYIVSANSIESETIDYIDFIQFGNKVEETYKSKSAGNVLVNMELQANPNCKIDVVLDEVTGDIIKGEGEGLLKISVGNKEPLTINGRYDITKGEYTFNFQTFLKKYFTVNSGSLIWEGDPYKANINILAEYLATNVDFSSLGTATQTGISSPTSVFNQRSNLEVVAHLTETLLKPAIDFELKLPPGSAITDFLILKRLEQFKQDKNELNKQVTSLLLFNSFINTSQGFITASSGYNVISSTIGGVVSNAISGFFNKVLQRYVKNLVFNLDVNSSLGNTGNLQADVAQLQAAAKSNFVYTLMNGRLIISAGLNLDYNNPYVTATRSSNLLVTPDITAEWVLTKDGRVRVVGFNRTNYDLVGQRNRTGISLS